MVGAQTDRQVADALAPANWVLHYRRRIERFRVYGRRLGRRTGEPPAKPVALRRSRCHRESVRTAVRESMEKAMANAAKESARSRSRVSRSRFNDERNEEDIMAKVCNKCGGTLEAGQGFCNNCGTESNVAQA